MRYLTSKISHDLKTKMVFISGPRQSGKTTMVQELIGKAKNLYLNWDNFDHRKKVLKKDWSDEDKIICFDEIHKYSRWKNFVKGVYDTQKNTHQFIITGSARLDIYKKGQDSMLGRFLSWRLHPLCLAELKYVFQSTDKNNIWKLLTLGAFPEPFLKDDEQFAKRWRRERINLIVRQDIRELENIRDISLVEIFHQALTERVASQVVLSNIARDIEIAPKTAKSWLAILEKTYALFIVTPYSKNISKAITKTPKVYFYDNGEVNGDEGARFENLVATHLLKRLHYLEDSTGDRYELNYLRDKQNHEVDFVIVKNRKAVALIEAKVSDQVRSRSLYYFKEKLKIDLCLQLVLNLEETSTRDGIKLVPAVEWLSQPLDKELF